MNIKKFLKPDWRKIFVFIILFGISFLYTYPIGIGISNQNNKITEYGFPLKFLTCVNDMKTRPLCLCGFPLLIFDLIFWYLPSCLIVWIYDKIKKR